MAQFDDKSITLTFVGSNKMCSVEGIYKTDTIKDVKEKYLSWYGGSRNNVCLRYMGKILKDNKKLMDYNICSNNRTPIMITYRVMGGGGSRLFEECNNEWKIMYERCPVCVFKNRNEKNKLPKGYWYHPSGDQCYFVTSKPSSTYAVETKYDKIRCGNCKKESDGLKWMFKCSNHDYEKVNL